MKKVLLALAIIACCVATVSNTIAIIRMHRNPENEGIY